MRSKKNKKKKPALKKKQKRKAIYKDKVTKINKKIPEVTSILDNPSEIEKKWQRAWERMGIFKVKENPKKQKYYVLEMFPYPSASYLHLGHVRNYTMGDVIARFKRMQGFNVLYPMGYDSFGLPAENAAKKEGKHPRNYTENAIKKIMEYQKALGNSYDWSRVISTHSPEYYKWNQYFFTKFFDKGLVYRKKSVVNWCPTCNTVLANEEVISGRCWRCDSEVTENEVEHWFFRITAYADRLLEGLKKLEWSDQIKKLQEEWIGKSYGVNINFTIDGKVWPIFTTRPDTIYGVTFMVISTKHPKLKELVAGTPYEQKVLDFSKKCCIAKNEEKEKLDKEGVFIGRYAVNPLTKEKVPVYVGNFVLAEYGCGMVMAVPAHDQRDFEFAKKYGLPIKIVIQPKNKELKVEELTEAYTGDGVLVNSGQFSGMNNREAIEKISDYIEAHGLGKKTVNYKIKDWCISRQRYWGTPIPIIYCEKCGIVPVPEKALPVLLPEDVSFKGASNPILSSKKFCQTKCPKCGKLAKRETDTMGGFMDSSWYFLRYCDPKNNNLPFDKKKVKYWMPVDQYIGGIEHAVGHLIYSRFFTKALHDLGFIDFDEPFMKLFNQGIVYKDGKKMSKNYGNTVTQEEISKKYGIDTARIFLMFVASPESSVDYSEKGIEGAYKFIKKVVALAEKPFVINSPKIEHYTNLTIKEVTNYIEDFKFNLALIKLMCFVDKLERECSKESYEVLLKLLSPFAPHFCEELWHKIGNNTFIALEQWPKHNEDKINKEIEKEEIIIEQLQKDVRQIIDIVKKNPTKIYIYTIPKEKEFYEKIKDEIEKKFGCDVFIYANNQVEYDPQRKAQKAKPGKPAIYVE